MPRFKPFLIAATAALAGAAPIAQAAPVSFHISSASFDEGPGYGRGVFDLDVRFRNGAFEPQSFDLDAANPSYTFDIGTVRLAEDFFVNPFELNKLWVTAELLFTSPDTSTAPLHATGNAEVGFVYDWFRERVDYTLDWAPFDMAFGDGGLFEISLGSLSFDQPGTKVQTATITLKQAPASSVPEPGTLALAGLALAGLGFIRSRRSRRG